MAESSRAEVVAASLGVLLLLLLLPLLWLGALPREMEAFAADDGGGHWTMELRSPPDARAAWDDCEEVSVAGRRRVRGQ